MPHLVFEGAAHPYKENLVKFEGRLRKKMAPKVEGDVTNDNSL